jgi:protease IV
LYRYNDLSDMANILLDIMRGRMMVDRRMAEEVYLPWMLSVMNGTLQPGTMLREKKDFIPMAFSTGGRSAMEDMQMAQAGSVAIIPIMGEFLKRGTACTYGADEVSAAIFMAADLKNISAIVLDVDSGGGAENAVPPFIDAIKYAQTKGKPVVLHGDVVASAAYYVGSFCDYLMADNLMSSAFGSIGVYVSYIDYREKFEKEGIKLKTFYAPQSTLKNHEHRELVDNNNEQPLIDNILIPSADRFIATVKQNRKGKIKDDSDAYKGKLFEGSAIVEEGLADGFGSLYDACEVAGSMAQLRRSNF